MFTSAMICLLALSPAAAQGKEDRELRWRGGYRARGGAPLATGLAVGALTGAAIASSNQASQNAYDNSYYYGQRKLGKADRELFQHAF
jgi:hypothetical protein